MLVDALVGAAEARADPVSMLTLVALQFVMWTVVMELAYKPTRYFFSRFPFWWRVGNLRSSTGQETWDEIPFGFVASLQHFTGLSWMAYAIYSGDSAWFRRGIASEMAFEANDLIYIFLRIGRHRTASPLLTVLMTAHHLLGLVLGVPCALTASENPHVQRFGVSLLGSGSLLAASVVVQYFPSRRTVGGCRAGLAIAAAHAAEFTWVRFVYPFTHDDFFELLRIARDERSTTEYALFVFTMAMMSIFSLLVSLLCWGKVAKSVAALRKAQQLTAAAPAAADDAKVPPSVVYTVATLRQRFGSAGFPGKSGVASPLQRLRAAALVAQAKVRMVRLVEARKTGTAQFPMFFARAKVKAD